jgi:hypothetical protein
MPVALRSMPHEDLNVQLHEWEDGREPQSLARSCVDDTPFVRSPELKRASEGEAMPRPLASASAALADLDPCPAN